MKTQTIRQQRALRELIDKDQKHRLPENRKQHVKECSLGHDDVDVNVEVNIPFFFGVTFGLLIAVISVAFYTVL